MPIARTISATLFSATIFTLAFVLNGCSSNPHHVQAQVSISDLSGYQTFRVEAVQIQSAYLSINEMIGKAMNDVMQDKGFEPAVDPESADLVVRFMTRVTHQDVTQTESVPDEHGNFFIQYRMTPVHEGALLVNVLDAKTHQLAWKGSTIRDISRVDVGAVTQEQVSDAVEELMQTLPTRDTGFSF